MTADATKPHTPSSTDGPTDVPPPVAVPREALLLAGSIFLLIAATNILTPLLPEIRTDFGVSITTAGFIVGSYGLARLAVDLPAGFLADKVGPRRLSVIAIGILLVASVLGGLAGSVEQLIAARIGSGVAVGILATVILSALSATATPANRGKVMSLFHVANNTGIALYPMVGGLLGTALGWRATFGVTFVLALVAGAILLPLLLRIDLRGSGSGKGGGDAALVLYGRQRAVAIAVTNYGVVANMIHRHGFRNTILPLYAATALGLGGISIATAIALMSITGLIVATPGGMLGDRLGRRRVITAGLAAVAVGDLVFLLTGDLVTFLLAAALIGFGDFFTSSQTALLSEVVPPEGRTKVLSGYRFSADLGALIGPVLLAAIMDGLGAQVAIVVASIILFSASLAARFGVPSVRGRRADALST
ncbi:MAG TPA: MFS transporter [Patescibacteria group bacterium]|nr:MFS transporter [Patescibacteria group bacterium]